MFCGIGARTVKIDRRALRVRTAMNRIDIDLTRLTNSCGRKKNNPTKLRHDFYYFKPAKT